MVEAWPSAMYCLAGCHESRLVIDHAQLDQSSAPMSQLRKPRFFRRPSNYVFSGEASAVLQCRKETQVNRSSGVVFASGWIWYDPRFIFYIQRDSTSYVCSRTLVHPTGSDHFHISHLLPRSLLRYSRILTALDQYQAHNTCPTTGTIYPCSLTRRYNSHGESQSVLEWTVNFEELPVCHQCSSTIRRRCLLPHLWPVGYLLRHSSSSECISGLGEQRECTQGAEYWRCVTFTSQWQELMLSRGRACRSGR